MADQPANGKEPSIEPSSVQKKTYVAPCLVRWGTLRDQTMAVGRVGGPDGGSSKKNTRA
jgi:hypothetical protein